MAGSSDFKAFAIGSGADVLTPVALASMAELSQGFVTGQASSTKLNTVWRQASFVAAAIAQMMADAGGFTVIDGGVVSDFERQLAVAIHLAAYGIDSGSSNNYVVTYPVPLTAGTLIEGVTRSFRAAAANTGASTFSPSGMPAKPIWGPTLQPLLAGDIVAGGIVSVVWNPTINGGNGAWIKTSASSGALTAGQITAALGFTPYNATNPQAFIAGITQAMVIAALGFVPYNSSNPSGFIASINYGMIVSGLGFTPPHSDGAGASGTWPINVSGQSGYAVNAGNAYSCSGNSNTATRLSSAARGMIGSSLLINNYTNPNAMGFAGSWGSTGVQYDGGGGGNYFGTNWIRVA